MSKKSARKSSATRTNRINVQPEVRTAIEARIISLLGRTRTGAWEGTMTDLNTAITAVSKRATPANWPATPSVLRRVVNVVIPSLRRSGVRVQFTRTTDHMRTRMVSFVQA
jgi:hypothetical protein